MHESFAVSDRKQPPGPPPHAGKQRGKRGPSLHALKGPISSSKARNQRGKRGPSLHVCCTRIWDDAQLLSRTEKFGRRPCTHKKTTAFCQRFVGQRRERKGCDREGEMERRGGGMNMAYRCLLQSSRVWHQRSRAGDLSARHFIAQGLGFGV